MKAKNVIWKRNSTQHLLLLLMKHSDPWTLRLRSRAKRCRFSFIISTNSRLSIRFDLRPFTLEFESKPESAFSLKRKLKFIQIFRSGDNGIVKSWVTSNYWFGKRRRRRKKVDLLWVVLLAVVIVIMVQQFRSYFRSRFLWNLVWMALPSEQFFKEILDGLYRCLGF